MTPRVDILRSPRHGRTLILSSLAALLLLTSCRQDMHDQPKYEPFEESDFFSDAQSSRLQIDGTVARGQLQEDPVFYRGLDANGELVSTLPIHLDAATLARGRVLYDVYCSPCHDRTGYGNGMIVRRGFKRPESFHATRLKESAPGYFFQVMTNGFGEMSPYNAQMTPAERWAVAGYVRALQLSQTVPVDQLSAADQVALSGDAPPAVQEETH